MNVVCPVVTRAQAKAGVESLPDLDSSLCEGGTKGLRKSRHQRRFDKHLKLPEPDWGNASVNMWGVPDNTSVLQREDETLKPLFAKVLEGSEGKCLGRERFIIENDVLHAVNEEHKRLVLANCRSLVMHQAHTFPWAGHVGRHKAYL